MKIVTHLLFPILFLPLMSCVPDGSLDSTSMPSETATLTATPVPHTPTFTPAPPTPTFTQTSIPTMVNGYLSIMQLSTFRGDDKWIQQFYFPEDSLTISRIAYKHIPPYQGTYLKIESSISIVKANEYAEVRGVGWSPGGNYFVYAASNNNALGNWCLSLCEGIELWITSHDGSFKKMLSSDTTRLSHKRISWHPDESKFITFCSSDENNENELSKNLEICIVHIPSGEIKRTGNFGEYAKYSPSGDSYLYYDSNADFYLVPESSHQPLNILSSDFYFSVSDIPGFIWSPDGKYFYSILKPSNSKNALFRIPLDGTLEKLIDVKKNYLIQSISPNGLYILMCDFSPGIDLYSECDIFDIEKKKLIATESFNDYSPPEWTPDSEFLVKGNTLDLANGSTTEIELMILMPDNKFFPFSRFTYTSNIP